jgi:hypothetical protein
MSCWEGLSFWLSTIIIVDSVGMPVRWPRMFAYKKKRLVTRHSPTSFESPPQPKHPRRQTILSRLLQPSLTSTTSISDASRRFATPLRPYTLISSTSSNAPIITSSTIGGVSSNSTSAPIVVVAFYLLQNVFHRHGIYHKAATTASKSASGTPAQVT